MRELQQLREQHESTLVQLRAGYEGKVAELTKAAHAAEAAAQREKERAREAAAQADSERSKAAAVKELMRHSEELQTQVGSRG